MPSSQELLPNQDLPETAQANDPIELIKRDHPFGSVLAGFFERKVVEGSLLDSSHADYVVVRGKTSDGLQMLLTRHKNSVNFYAAPDDVSINRDKPSQQFSVSASDSIVYKGELISSITSAVGMRLAALAHEVATVMNEVRSKFEGVEIDGNFFVRFPVASQNPV